MRVSRRAVAVRAAGLLVLVAAGAASAAPDWRNAPQAPTPRAEGTLIEHDGDILLLNGFTFGIKLQNTVERYDPASRRWSSLRRTTTSGPLPTAVSHQGTVVVGDEAWFIGGRVGNHPGRVTRTVAIYDLEKDTWRAGPTLPVPFASGGAALVGRRIHLIGGLDGEARCDVATHLVHDLDQPGKGWQDITAEAALPLPRNHFGTVLHEGLIYVVGGQNGHDKCARLDYSGRNVRHVHAYDPAKGTWRRLKDMPFAQSHTEPSIFAHDGLIWVVGGQAQGNKILNYDPAANSWTIRHDLVLPTKLIAPGARVIDGVLHVFGGGAPNVSNPVRVTRTLWVGGENDDAGGDTDDGTGGDGTVGGTGGGSGIVHEMRDGRVRIGATAHDRAIGRGAHAWTPWQEGALKASPDTGALVRAANVAASPQLVYKVRFERSGTHYVWVRGLGDAKDGEGKSDSLHVGLNGGVQSGSDRLDGHGPAWSWRRSTRDGHVASLSVPSAGVHELDVWMREDGLAISDLLITTDPDFRPDAGTGGGGADGGSDEDADAGSGDGADAGTGDGANGDDGGTPRLEIAPLDIDFGDVAIGGSARRELVLRNLGDAPAAIDRLLVQGTAAASYRLLDAPPATLAAGATRRLGIEFAPTAAGEHVAIASLLHDPESTLTLVSLSGRGEAAGGGTGTDGDGTGAGGGTDDPGADGTRYHVNAGGPDVSGPDGTLWRSDLGGPLAAHRRTPSWTWSSDREIALDAGTAALDAPAALFATERYGSGGDLVWDFPVEPGDYLVHLFFAEIYPGAAKPGGRVFDVVLEGETRLADLDVFVASGRLDDAGVPTLVRSFAVSSDATLTLALLREVQNPAIKAIAIHPCPSPCTALGIDNRAPRVAAGEDRRIALGDTLALDGRAEDDGRPGGTLATLWTQRAGPSEATFGDATDAATTVTFPASGSYTLRLSADDGALAARDELIVTVTDAQGPATADFVETEGRVTIEAEAYTRRTASATHGWNPVEEPGASGALAMVSGPDVGALSRAAAGSPMLAYEIAFEAPGRRYVWIRGSGDTNALGEGKSDSLHAGLNGELSPSADKIDVFPAGWSWSRHTRDGIVASIEVPSAGVHTLNLWMREDGLKVDRIHLTRDAEGRP